MKRKILYIIILSFILISGCSNSNNLKLFYTENTSEDLQCSTGFKETAAANLFADSLCVIPAGTDNQEDGNLPASSNLIVNVDKKKVVYADNIYEKLYPASITKILTALVVLEKGNLSDTVTVSYNASHITESGAKLCGLKEGDKINLYDLLCALLIYSGNDAGTAIAEHIGGTEEGFAKIMNETVKELGATDSNFVNAHGLHDDNHYTTAYDLYLIFNKLVTYDKFIDIITSKDVNITYEDKDGNAINKNYENTNRYVKGTETAPEKINVIGGKTGTTYKAGNCLILYSQEENSDHYISVILKSDSGNALFSQMTYLLKMIYK